MATRMTRRKRIRRFGAVLIAGAGGTLQPGGTTSQKNSQRRRILQQATASAETSSTTWAAVLSATASCASTPLNIILSKLTTGSAAICRSGAVTSSAPHPSSRSRKMGWTCSWCRGPRFTMFRRAVSVAAKSISAPATSGGRTNPTLRIKRSFGLGQTSQHGVAPMLEARPPLSATQLPARSMSWSGVPRTRGNLFFDRRRHSFSRRLPRSGL
mmetsp:Transcript_68894/g.161455  ORF Transcript_68894/g.161455 Transcript_68894/m.161455 type:complete len:213 (+) Transcript_68894:261-899(+)